MPENVLHILGTAQREGTGIAGIVSALARRLNPAQYRVHAWFLAGDGPLATDLLNAGAEVREVDWRDGARGLVGALRFWRCLRDTRFGIIHQHYGGRTPRWLARSGGQAKIITHLHGHVSESRGLATLPITVNNADFVIATSQAVAKCVRGARVRVVYPGVDIRNNGSLNAARPSERSEIVIGTAGRLVPLKGIVYLVRAVALLYHAFPKIRLEIAGSGPERPALEHEVQVHNLGNCVRFLGWQADLGRVLPDWDIYVQPSIGEPFGIAALEAMAAGLPVVATAAGGLPELVEDSRTGWVVPARDPLALSVRLRELLLDAEQRHVMGAAGQARALDSFSLDRMVKIISNLYEEVLNDVDSRPR